MRKYNDGGYIMLDLAASDVFLQAKDAFEANKPIMVYDDSQVYYADTCVYDSDNDAYILTKGGNTITIDSSNNVVSSGGIQNHLYRHSFYVYLSPYEEAGDAVQGYVSIDLTEKLEFENGTKLTKQIFDKLFSEGTFVTGDTTLYGFYNYDDPETKLVPNFVTADGSNDYCKFDDDCTILTTGIVQLF